jgi:hypothetical protein
VTGDRPTSSPTLKRGYPPPLCRNSLATEPDGAKQGEGVGQCVGESIRQAHKGRTSTATGQQRDKTDTSKGQEPDKMAKSWAKYQGKSLASHNRATFLPLNSATNYG